VNQTPEVKPVTPEAHTAAERASDTELVVSRTFDAPPHVVFQAWSQADLFGRWWVPKSSGLRLLACEMDVRTGGRYRLEFSHPSFEQPMAFFGTYIEVVPDRRIVWNNEEGGEGAVTTVTFEEVRDSTLLTVRDRYPSKEALDAEIHSGATEGLCESLEQLADFLTSRPL
jgi:uncharacterized protein YndB with AHSA1/START domain